MGWEYSSRPLGLLKYHYIIWTTNITYTFLLKMSTKIKEGLDDKSIKQCRYSEIWQL